MVRNVAELKKRRMSITDFYLRAGLDRRPELDREAAEILVQNGRDFINRGLSCMFVANFTPLLSKYAVVDLQVGLSCC